MSRWTVCRVSPRLPTHLHTDMIRKVLAATLHISRMRYTAAAESHRFLDKQTSFFLNYKHESYVRSLSALLSLFLCSVARFITRSK